jgi:hypothetical protein
MRMERIWCMDAGSTFSSVDYRPRCVQSAETDRRFGERDIIKGAYDAARW